jgi:hypothetical protein
MAKKAAARRSTATKRAKSTTRKAAGRRAAARPRGRGVDFKPLHDAMDATLAELNKFKKGFKRDKLILQLKLLRKFRPCPTSGMFVEME